MRKGLLLGICLVGFALAGCETNGVGVATSATEPAPMASAEPAPMAAANEPGVAASPITQTPPATFTVQEPTDVKYYRSDEPLKLALEHFNRGNFGLAAKYFEDAVTKAPKDASAWVGLAASYDRIGRFDLADRAYRQAIRLVGETTAILNNEGYSYMLRGRFIEARRKLLKAYEREPTNPTVLNNLKLLDSSERYVRRDQDPNL
jgi:tetratricopeptide (TPR) repeat protein